MQSDLHRYGIEYTKWFFRGLESDSGLGSRCRSDRSGLHYEKDGALGDPRLRAEGKTERRSPLDLRTTFSAAPTASTPILPPTSPITATSSKKRG